MKQPITDRMIVEAAKMFAKSIHTKEFEVNEIMLRNMLNQREVQRGLELLDKIRKLP